MTKTAKRQDRWALPVVLILLQFANCGQPKMHDRFETCLEKGLTNCDEITGLYLYAESYPGAGTVGPVVEEAQSQSITRVIGPGCQTEKRFQTISVIHVSDLHAHYAPGDDGVSAYARLAGYVDTVRGQNPYTLFTDGGDDYEKGSIAEQLSNGYATMEVTHAMGFDVRVLGNHDFAWSVAHTAEFSRDPRAVVLSSNIECPDTDPEFWHATDYAELQLNHRA
ncbi:MAG: hypothetical protein JXA30_22565 [Deltaproteobacteria bacterium]|nr:hypothetical protein [Deltaproteobacteria bacterium]